MRVGKVLADYRHENRMGVRALAAEIGLSSATLNRIENDMACDGDTLLKVMLWLFGDDRPKFSRRGPNYIEQARTALSRATK